MVVCRTHGVSRRVSELNLDMVMCEPLLVQKRRGKSPESMTGHSAFVSHPIKGLQTRAVQVENRNAPNHMPGMGRIGVDASGRRRVQVVGIAVFGPVFCDCAVRSRTRYGGGLSLVHGPPSLFFGFQTSERQDPAVCGQAKSSVCPHSFVSAIV